MSNFILASILFTILICEVILIIWGSHAYRTNNYGELMPNSVLFSVLFTTLICGVVLIIWGLLTPGNQTLVTFIGGWTASQSAITLAFKLYETEN